MKARILPAVLLLLLSASCTKDGLYIPLTHTVWDQTSKDQTARICFADDRHVSILQMQFDNGVSLASNGLYTADGHAVSCYNPNGEGSTVSFIRTFSHLKYKKDNRTENLGKLSPCTHTTLAGSVWATSLDKDLLLAYFPENGQVVSLRYHRLDQNGGWTCGRQHCQLEDKRLTVDRNNKTSLNVTLYEDVMLVDTLGVLCVNPAIRAEEMSTQPQQVWVWEGDGAAEVLLFNAALRFTHITAAMASIKGLSRLVFYTVKGSISGSGGQLQLTPENGSAEPCTLQDGQLVYQDKVFVPADV